MLDFTGTPIPPGSVGDDIIVDCFAGGGGASTGFEMALGRSPDYEINHSGPALALHAANHPDTIHLNSNIWDVEPADVTAGRKIAALWASPDCKHFSKAKGGKPKDRNIRDLAWAVVKWARLPKSQRPDVILMENVEEFKTWGPVCDAGKVIEGLEGTTFEEWMRALKSLGYKVEWRELRACDYGSPTIRKRFFMIARCDGRKIVWPKPTHGAPDSPEVQSGKLRPWRTAAECIDWSLPCPSIFDSADQIKEKHGLRAVRPLAENTLARVARGMKRYVIDADNPFLVNLTHGGREESAAEPFRTITGANRGEKAVIAPTLANVANSKTTGRAPNAWTVKEPFRTITGGCGFTVVAPHLATMRNAKKPFNGANEPTHTITAGGAGLSLVSAHLMSLKGTSRRDSHIGAPHPTILAGGGHSALISPVLTYAQHGGANRDVREPHHTICANLKDQNSVIVPALVRHFGKSVGQDIGFPAPTTTAGGGGKTALLAPLIAQQNTARSGVNPGRAADTPFSTLTGSGSQQNVIAPYFAKYYGTGDGARADDPCHTITVKDRFSHVQAQLAAPEFTSDMEYAAYRVARFLEAHGAWDDRRFVTLTIGGTEYVVVDIGLRMLTPRELFNAQGFPPDYVIDGVWKEDGDNWTFKPFTKSTQVSCCGNSVCPDLAAALVRSNCAHLIEERKAA